MRTDRSGVFESLRPDLSRLLPGLNRLAAALLTTRARSDGVRGSGLTVPQLAPLGITDDDCRDLMARGLVESRGRLSASSLVVLTDAGLALLQDAIPDGAIRPIFDVRSRRLMVAGEVILPLAVQARNLAAFLKSIEDAGWAPRIEKPLNGRVAAADAHRLAVAAHRLTAHQRLLDFHADDGAATWNWRRRSVTEV